jgi:hypothetical protein
MDCLNLQQDEKELPRNQVPKTTQYKRLETLPTIV